MKLLFTTLPSNDLGLLTRSLPIAKELRKSGNEIIFSSPAKSPTLLIKDAGFENIVPKHPLYQIGKLRPKHFFRRKAFREEYGSVFKFVYQLATSIPTKIGPATAEIWNMDHAAAIAGMTKENFVRANCEAYRKLIIESDVDAVIDFWNPFACIAARTLRKPLITIIQSDAHPANKGLIWWKETPENLPTALPSINAVMAEYGLKPITKVEDLSIGDLTLVVGTPDLDPIPQGNVYSHIGPILWEKSDDTLPEWIVNIKNPLIWVYSGNPQYGPKETVFDSKIIIQASIQVLSTINLNVILTTGNHKLPKEFLPLPDNFFFAPFLPGLKLAKRCDLMVHHGGYGSCQTGLYTGTPAVIVPTFSERESNARRVAAVGAGEYVLPRVGKGGKREIDLDEFRYKINLVLSTHSYLVNARKQSKKLASFGGPEKAAQLIEGFLSNLRQVP
jgi:UDP:flavonoid glycosyltransferase YjiC (YdhE family)